MSQMTTLVILLVLTAAAGVMFVIMVARETERTHPELGDLPAALLTIFLIACMSCAIEKLLRLDDTEMTDAASSVTQERGR